MLRWQCWSAQQILIKRFDKLCDPGSGCNIELTGRPVWAMLSRHAIFDADHGLFHAARLLLRVLCMLQRP